MAKNGNGKTNGFNAQAFLQSAGLAKKIVEFRRDEVVFSQGDRCENVMYIQRGGVNCRSFRRR
jgi:CRP-like cAMP-binding protein